MNTPTKMARAAIWLRASIIYTASFFPLVETRRMTNHALQLGHSMAA
jgi:hypothetical protein